MTTKKTGFLQGSLFEEDYLIRTLGALAHSPETALTELVANAWDAGATTVNIIIPEDYDGKIVIDDNGTGLTKSEFYSRWMRLGYNRIKHQGRTVRFPSDKNGKRLAYGRNGIGRHGLLCFNNNYNVVTSSGGTESKFKITTTSESQPFVIESQAFKKTKKTGTRLEVVVKKNLPNSTRILNIISARFLHDPNFKITINNQTVNLESHQGLIDSRPINADNINLTGHFIDSQKAGKSTLYQGIAFWEGGRLVGEPSWILGNNVIIDGRTRFAKRYTVVIKTNDLSEYVLEDWTGFKRSETVENVYNAVADYVNLMFSKLAMDNIEDTKQQIRSDFSQEISSLSPLAKYEVNEAIETITINHPTAKAESVSLAVEAIINLEKTRTGKELLSKLSKLEDDDIIGLNKLLEKWSVRDALTVLDEIDNRISVIEAIRKLSSDNEVDELHVLHPLVTSARWLFGPEFESAEFSSNRQLQTAVETVFKTKIKKGVFNNYRKRPDIVVLSNSTLSITGTETFENDSNLLSLSKVLIIELKRGGFKLTRKERDQATGYVEDFIGCGNIIGSPSIEAYVIGEEFSEKVQQSIKVGDRCRVNICTFSQIVDTAEKRLFGLRQKLNSRYEDVTGIELFNSQSVQLTVQFKAG